VTARSAVAERAAAAAHLDDAAGMAWAPKVMKANTAAIAANKANSLRMLFLPDVS